MSDEDLFGPPPEPPHPVEHAAKKPITYAEIDPRHAPKNLEIAKRMAHSRYWSDVCTCSVGDPDRTITRDRNPKCCKECPWCSMRIKVGFLKEHTAYCSAVDRDAAPIPWWRRPPGVSSAQPTSESEHAQPIEKASAVDASGGARVSSGSDPGTARKRREGVRRGRQKSGHQPAP